MASKAAKLSKKRAGRKLKVGVARTGSGAISRSKNPGEAPDKVARDARIKIFGIGPEHASTPQAASFMGRLSLLGTKGGGIPHDQYDALMRFSACREQYMLSISAPDSLRSKSTGGSTGIDDADHKARVKARYFAARNAIQIAQQEHPRSNLWSVVQYVVIDNLDFSHMIGDLRIVGNALMRHYQGLDRVSKAA